MVQWVVGSILRGGPIELCLVDAYITMCFHNVEQDVAPW